MREIKFRAWYKPVTENGRMIDVEQLNFSPNIEGVIVNDLPRQKYIKSLMQYTGLKDKNGQEIYEGDVIWYGLNLTGNKYMGEVVFDEGCFQLKSPLAQELLPLYGSDELEVIGNIYENPELLK